VIKKIKEVKQDIFN